MDIQRLVLNAYADDPAFVDANLCDAHSISHYNNSSACCAVPSAEPSGWTRYMLKATTPIDLQLQNDWLLFVPQASILSIGIEPGVVYTESSATFLNPITT